MSDTASPPASDAYNLQGTCDPAFSAVRDAFLAGFAAGEELGAGIACYYRGTKVVDLVAGWASEDRAAPFLPSSIHTVHSAGKNLESVSLAHAVGKGALSYDQTIASAWPEFAAGGKEGVLVKDLAEHMAGVGWLDEAHWPRIEELTDLEALGKRIAGQPHNFGGVLTKSYHGLTRGWFINELLRRTLGRSHGSLVREWSSALGTDAFVGLPASEDARFVPVVFTPANIAMFKMIATLPPDLPVAKRTKIVGAPEPEETGGLASNVLDVLRGETPSAYTVSNAAGLASFANLMSLGGTHPALPSLIPAETFALAHELEPRNLDKPDAVAGAPIRTCVGGFSKSLPGLKLPCIKADWSAMPPKFEVPEGWKGDGWTWFGWDGLGGSLLQWDPERRCAFAYSPTLLYPGGGFTDARAARCMLAFVECVEKLESGEGGK